MTLLELVLASLVFLVATSVFLRTLVALSGQRAVNRENAVAADATRNLIETMRNEVFGEVFALYNADASDDPVQLEPIPGNRFAVAGLAPLPDSPDGLVGEVFFPVVDALGGAGPDLDLELREDVVDAELGTPRDLNGDSLIDDLDHTGDYYLLPLSIRLRWQGRHGPREYVTTTMLCDLTP
jgi:type II secretory pathway pseudopilin PulG